MFFDLFTCSCWYEFFFLRLFLLLPILFSPAQLQAFYSCLPSYHWAHCGLQGLLFLLWNQRQLSVLALHYWDLARVLYTFIGMWWRKWLAARSGLTCSYFAILRFRILLLWFDFLFFRTGLTRRFDLLMLAGSFTSFGCGGSFYVVI